MYLNDLDLALNKLISFLNLDLNPATSGSFDRYFWGWKKRDFQDSTLAYAFIPLIKAIRRTRKLEETNIWYVQEIVVKNILNIQLSDGSFDQSYPNEKHPKVGLDIASVLYEYLKTHQNRQVFKAYKKLIEYSLRGEETYGVICNHLAHYAYEYLLAYDYFQDKKYYEKAIEYLHIIKDHTHEEGWHLEYLGGDPGYQTRALRYLTKCLELLKNDTHQKLCEELCLKSADFLNKVLLPDGTLYAMFGSRNTAVIYPSGIEYMAYHYPEKYSYLAFRIRESVRNKVAILPLQLEFDNFIRLFDDFLDAQVYYEKNKNLTVEKKTIEDFDLSVFGLKKTSVGQYAIYFHYKYGGAIAVYKNNELFYKEAGFLIKDSRGYFWGTRNLLSHSKVLKKENFIIKIETPIFKSIHQELTPLKLVIIRMLNLTLLKIPSLADFFRKVIVSSIITGKPKKHQGVVRRALKINQTSIEIKDEFDLKIKPRQVYRTIFLNLFHMASSRYFHPVDQKFPFYRKEQISSGTSRFWLEKKLELKD